MSHRPLQLAALGWLVLVLVLPIGIAIDEAGSLQLAEVEWRALARAWVRGASLAVVVATVSTLIGLVLARAVSPFALVGLLLTSRAIDSLGVLACGFRPGLLAAGLALVVDLAPLAALLILLRLRTRPVELLECAADLGAGPLARARWIGWPHLRPALLVAVVWTTLEVLGDAVALDIAGGGKAYAPGLLIRDALVHDLAPARGLVGLLGLVVVALACAWLLAGELRRSEMAGFRSLPPAAPPARALGYAAFTLLAVAPLALVAGQHPTGFGAQDELLLGLLARTGAIGLGLGLVAAGVGFVLAVALGPTPSRFVATALVLPLAVPGTVFGMLALSTARWFGLAPGTALTVLALLPQSLALGFLVARVLSSVVPRSLIEAAADLGAGTLARLRWVWLPLGRPALVVGFTVVFTWVIGQAATPAWTSGPGGDTLAVGLTVLARGGAMPVVRRWAVLIIVVPLLLAWSAVVWRKTG